MKKKQQNNVLREKWLHENVKIFKEERPSSYNNNVNNFMRQKYTDLKCLDGISKCPRHSTCCPLLKDAAKNKSNYGCCPAEEAVCCEDKMHCCPQGTNCDERAGRCLEKKVKSI